MALRSQSHACCYFTGVVNVGSSNIVLKSETVFANTILIHPHQRKELRVLERCFEERIIEAQHEREGTEDINRGSETKLLPKVYLRDQGTRQSMNRGGLHHTSLVRQIPSRVIMNYDSPQTQYNPYIRIPSH